MRWIVVSLLLVNALIFGWRWWAGRDDAAIPVHSATTAAAPTAIELLADGAIVQASEETQAEAASPTTVSVASDSSIAVPDSPEPAVDEAVISEPASAAIIESPPASAELSAYCAWSDWQEKPGALEPELEIIKEEARELELGRSYLVYIPAKSNREQTLARLAEVKVLGVEAAYLNKGPQTGGISLGLFSKPESMQVRMNQLAQAGINDARGIERIRTEAQTRRLLRWTGEKTPTSVQNQALVSCNDVAPTAAGQ